MSDFEHQEEQEQAEELRQKIADAYKRLFSSGPDASLVLFDLMEYAPVFRPSINEPEDGMRRVVLRILRLSGAEKRMKRALGIL
jgi:hypothetical protein